MEKLRIGVIGMGFVGALHLDAIRRIGDVELAAVADVNLSLAQQKAQEYGVPFACQGLDPLLAEGRVDVIHNCTPNHLHQEVNLKVIRQGLHLFAEKPLTRTVAEAQPVMEALQAHPAVVAGINHCYRMNPMVQQMRRMVQQGEIGTPRLLHGAYLQDHLLNETDYSWRIDPQINGPSRAIADIGTHWMDTVQQVVGSRITSVCADLVTVMPRRKKPRGQVATFSRNTSTEFDEIVIENEDYGSVLFTMENGVHGVFTVSQVSAGHGCGLQFELNGSKASLRWDQEHPNQVWVGRKEGGNLLLDRNPVELSPEALPYTHLAKGHPEGWNDTLRNALVAYYQQVRSGKPADSSAGFATFADAFYLLRLVEAILESDRTKSWVRL